ncbi:MAG: hypothetical protein AUI33_13815 [Ignavibacteria bacterium 13_1_40CM_2_61_4]|nr:MAG: hypothetical protein AUI33_13815 [Ignavibacteria bacterium 13_1_40CM_2_61_4]
MAGELAETVAAQRWEDKTARESTKDAGGDAVSLARAVDLSARPQFYCHRAAALNGDQPCVDRCRADSITAQGIVRLMLEAVIKAFMGHTPLMRTSVLLSIIVFAAASSSSDCCGRASL